MKSVENLPIKVNRGKIAGFCRAHGIGRLSLFGSVLRDDFDPDRSDVDVLVEFLPGRTPGWEFFTWHEELKAILGHKVDLFSGLNQWLEPLVRRETLAIYDQA